MILNIVELITRSHYLHPHVHLAADNYTLAYNIYAYTSAKLRIAKKGTIVAQARGDAIHRVQVAMIDSTRTQ